MSDGLHSAGGEVVSRCVKWCWAATLEVRWRSGVVAVLAVGGGSGQKKKSAEFS